MSGSITLLPLGFDYARRFNITNYAAVYSSKFVMNFYFIQSCADTPYWIPSLMSLEEWFMIPLETLDKAVKILIEDDITRWVYDKSRADIVLR